MEPPQELNMLPPGGVLPGAGEDGDHYKEC